MSRAVTPPIQGRLVAQLQNLPPLAQLHESEQRKRIRETAEHQSSYYSTREPANLDRFALQRYKRMEERAEMRADKDKATVEKMCTALVHI